MYPYNWPNKSAWSLSAIRELQLNVSTHDVGIETLLRALLRAVQESGYPDLGTWDMQCVINLNPTIGSDTKTYSVKMAYPLRGSYRLRYTLMGTIAIWELIGADHLSSHFPSAEPVFDENSVRLPVAVERERFISLRAQEPAVVDRPTQPEPAADTGDQ